MLTFPPLLVDAPLQSLTRDVEARIAILEETKAQDKMEVVETPNEKVERKHSGISSAPSPKPAPAVPPRLRKNSHSAQTSGSTTSITASTSEGGGTSVGGSRGGSSKKKSKRVGVRFQEQKRFYFYEEDASPVVTSKIAAGFTSVPGVNDARFDPLVRELVRIALVPVTTSHAPFAETEILSYIQSAFSLDDDAWEALVQNERSNWNIYTLISNIMSRLQTLNQHPFYTAATFRSEEEYDAWRSFEAGRLLKLIDRLKQLAPDFDEKCPPRRNTPSRSKSKSGIEDSTSSMRSGGGGAGSAGRSNVHIKPKRRDTSGNVHASISNAPGSSLQDSDDVPLSAVPPGGFFSSSAASGGGAISYPSVHNSKGGGKSSSKDSGGNRDRGGSVSGPTSTGGKKSSSSSSAVVPDESDDSKSVTSESVSADATAWTGRGLRVAIKPLQFYGDDSTTDDDAATSTVDMKTPTSNANSRRPSISATAHYHVPDPSNEQQYSGSDTGISPRGDTDEDVDNLNDDEGDQNGESAVGGDGGGVAVASSSVRKTSKQSKKGSSSTSTSKKSSGKSGKKKSKKSKGTAEEREEGAVNEDAEDGDSPNEVVGQDDSPLPDNSDESGQPMRAIQVSRKPRHASTPADHSPLSSPTRDYDDQEFVDDDGQDFDYRGGAFEDEQAEFAEKPDDFSSNDDGNGDVSIAPTPFEILFRTLIHFEGSNLRKQEKRIETIIPLLDRAHEAISSQFSLDRHVNMFDALPELNSDAFISGFSGINFFLNHPDTSEPENPSSMSGSTTTTTTATSTTASLIVPPKKDKKKDKKNVSKPSTAAAAAAQQQQQQDQQQQQQQQQQQLIGWKVPSWDVASELERVLFGISPVGRWLLGEYAIFWGYSPLYQNLVQLNHVVSFLMPSADMLLMLYVLMTRVLDLLQAEELEPIPSDLETFYFAQVMRELNRDAEAAFYNMFGQFSYEDLAALKMLLNILSLIYECNEFLGETPPKTYTAYLEHALEESVKNYYTEVVTDAEEPREMSGDPVGTNPSSAVRKRQRTERRTTANQLLAACQAMGDLLTHLDPFQELFNGLSKPLFDICCKAYIRQLFSDTSLFVIKMARTQPVAKTLALANGIIQINDLCAQASRVEVIEPLPVEKLFGGFLYDWLVQTEVTMKEWANTTCKIERWVPVDAVKGKLWSACSWDLYKMVLSHIPFVMNNETLFHLTVEAEEAELLEGGSPGSLVWNTNGTGGKSGSHQSGGKDNRLSTYMNHKAIGFTAESLKDRKKTFFYQYSLGVSRVLRDFIENIYNLFVEEFPTDLHSDLHDLYIRDYYNMTTGGSGLHLMYKKKKKSIFSWLTGKKSKADIGDDPSRHATLASSTSQPKLGKKSSKASLGVNNSSAGSSSAAGGGGGGGSNMMQRSTSANFLGGSGGSKQASSESEEEDSATSGFTSISSSAVVANGYAQAGIDHNDDPSRELIINVWSMIVFDPKKALKLRKLRKRIDMKQSMCIKLNDLDALRAFFDKLLQNEPLFQLAANPAFVLMHKVFRTFLHMIIYIINMHLDTELEHIYKKCGKKPSSSVFEAHLSLVSNLADQLALMKDNLRNNIFKRVLLRIWKVLQEDIAELLSPEDEDGKSKSPPTAIQIAALEALLETLKPILSGYGMSVNHINAKMEELLGSHRTDHADAMEKARSVYEAEKDKFMHKEKKKGTLASLSSSGLGGPTLKSSASSPALGAPSVVAASSSNAAPPDSSTRKMRKGGSKDSIRDSTDSSRSKSSAAAAGAAGSRKLPSLFKDGSSLSVSTASSTNTPIPATPNSSTTPASTPSTASTLRGRNERRVELSHQESASHFIREEAPLTESSEEADAYANIKTQIKPRSSDSDSDSGETAATTASYASHSTREEVELPPPREPKTAKPRKKGSRSTSKKPKKE